MAIIDIPVDDPKGNIIEFRKGPRKPDLEVVAQKWDACKHVQTFIDRDKREVTCQACSAVLDAFSVLLELANRQRRWMQELDEWDAHRESVLSNRYDEQWARDHDGLVSPPADPALRKVWDTFHAVMGDKFCRMYSRKCRKRNGPGWYGVSTDGGRLSYEYARSKLVPKAVAK